MAIQRGREMGVTIDDLHERIDILYRDRERDIDGNIVAGEIHTRATVWAKVLPISARIGERPQETENIVGYRITIRWRGKRLEIVSPPYDVESRRMWTVMECRELVEDVEEA